MERGADPVGEMMTSGASGRIIPVCRDISRSVLSRRTLLRVLLFLQSFFLWFLLLLQLTRRPLASRASGSPPASSSSSPLSSPRRRGGFRRGRREEEEDTLRRRILAEGLEMVHPSGGGVCSCVWETSVHVGPRRNALFCRSWVPAMGDMKGRDSRRLHYSHSRFHSPRRSRSPRHARSRSRSRSAYSPFSKRDSRKPYFGCNGEV